MIALDTNVVSEAIRPSPDPAVMAWLDSEDPLDLYLPTMVVAELLFGVERLPRGRRRNDVSGAVAAMIDDDFGGRILGFDDEAALWFAKISAARQRLGKSAATADMVIAASALAAGAKSLATRNTKDFAGTGIQLIDPWTVGPKH